MPIDFPEGDKMRRWAVAVVLLTLLTFACATGAHGSASLLPARGWLTLDTPHFLVHFPPDHEQLAREIALAAEEAHRTLVPQLQYLPEEQTHIVVADVSDAANAITNVTPYNRIVVYPVFPDTLGYYSGISPRIKDWLKQLLLHEYTHVIHQDMHGGSASQIRRLFGKVPWLATPNATQGLGVIEGYAVLQETVSGWGRGSDSLYDMFLRAATLENRLPTWDQILGSYDLPGWQPGPPYYLYGYSFLAYLSETYGAEKLAEVHRKHAEQPLTVSSTAFAEVLGVPFSQLWSDWQSTLRQRYQEQIDQINPVTDLQLLPSIGEVALKPAWRPDGKALLYGSVGGVVPALRLWTPDGSGGADTLVVNGYVDGANGYAWTPDGKHAVYAKMEADGATQVSDLFLYDFATGRETRLTKGYRAYAPTLAPEGDWVAFLSRRQGVSHVQIARLDHVVPTLLWSPVTGEEAPVRGPLQVTALAWSPGGDSIALTGRDRNGWVDLYLLPVRWQDGVPELGGELRRLTEDEAVEADPAWSPDGRYLFFASDRGGVYNIHAFDTGSQAMFQVTRVLYGVFSPAVAPDGATLAVSAYTADGYRLATLPIVPTAWTPWPAPARQAQTIMRLKAEEQPRLPQEHAPPLPDMNLQLSGPQLVLTPSVNWDEQLGREQPAWERDAAVIVDPAKFKVRKYSAADSLAPRYWLPVWGGESGGWLTGGSTAGEDALGQHAYALSLALGGNQATYDLAYEYRAGLLGSGPAVGLALSGTSASQDIPQSQYPLQAGSARSLLPAALAHNHTSVAGSSAAIYDGDDALPQGNRSAVKELYVAWQSPGMLDHRQTVISVREVTGKERRLEAIAGYSWHGLTGDGPFHFRQRFSVYGLQSLPGSPVETTAVVSWLARGEVPGRWRVSFSGTVAASSLSDRFTIGPEADGLPLRGLRSGYPEGQIGYQAVLEGEMLLQPVYRGVGEQPVFIENLSLAVFADAGAARNVGEAVATAVTLGTELRLTSSVGYGAARSDIRLGIARPARKGAPWRTYVGMGAGF